MPRRAARRLPQRAIVATHDSAVDALTRACPPWRRDRNPAEIALMQVYVPQRKYAEPPFDALRSAERSSGNSLTSDAAATTIAARGPKTAAANTVGMRDVDVSTLFVSRTRPRSSKAVATARPPTDYAIAEGTAGLHNTAMNPPSDSPRRALVAAPWGVTARRWAFINKSGIHLPPPPKGVYAVRAVSSHMKGDVRMLKFVARLAGRATLAGGGLAW